MPFISTQTAISNFESKGISTAWKCKNFRQFPDRCKAHNFSELIKIVRDKDSIWKLPFQRTNDFMKVSKLTFALIALTLPAFQQRQVRRTSSAICVFFLVFTRERETLVILLFLRIQMILPPSSSIVTCKI